MCDENNELGPINEDISELEVAATYNGSALSTKGVARFAPYCDVEQRRLGAYTTDNKVANQQARYHGQNTGHNTRVLVRRD